MVCHMENTLNATSHNPNPPGLYIHVPFCRSKCLYCDFYSVASSATIPAWLEAVQREMRLYGENEERSGGSGAKSGVKVEGYAEKHGEKSGENAEILRNFDSFNFDNFDSLYLGGGTPTVLAERDLAALMDSAHKHFTFLPDAEITIEANPDGLSAGKLKTIRDLGINRISLGIQSLSDADLKYLGRTHSSKQALDALDLIRFSGFSNMSVDLIYGLETQTIPGWKKTLDQILEFRPEHLSCYQLTFEPGTPLGKMKAAGKVNSIGEKLESAYFIYTSRYLEREGYLHYEISNFARSFDLKSRHNQKYWTHTPYLGLGPSAHSFHSGSRWWNLKSVRKYCRLLAEGKPPIESSEILTEEQLDLESLYLGLRTSAGVDLNELGGGLRVGNAFAELQRTGLVKISNGRILPTRKGFLVADSLPLMLNV